jgi:hypothetical protein
MSVLCVFISKFTIESLSVDNKGQSVERVSYHRSLPFPTLKYKARFIITEQFKFVCTDHACVYTLCSYCTSSLICCSNLENNSDIPVHNSEAKLDDFRIWKDSIVSKRCWLR